MILEHSSFDPCDQDYHGASPASEPETQALQSEAVRLQADDQPGVAAWVTVHSYGWMWMYSWGFTEDFTQSGDCAKTDDYDDMVTVSY